MNVFWEELENPVLPEVIKTEVPLVDKIWNILDFSYLTEIWTQDRAYEPPPEAESMSNFDVLREAAQRAVTSDPDFANWEAEARKRGISPLQYAEPIAAGFVFGGLAIYGILGFASMVRGSPTLQKACGKFGTVLSKVGVKPLGPEYRPTFRVEPGVDQFTRPILWKEAPKLVPFYTGLPMDQPLHALMREQFGTVGALQKVLAPLAHMTPAISSKLIEVAVQRPVNDRDILRAVLPLTLEGKEGVKASNELERNLLDVFDVERGVTSEEQAKIKYAEAHLKVVKEKPEEVIPDLGKLLEDIKGIAKPKVENPDYSEKLYSIQVTQAEELPKFMENRFYGWLLEAAGDVFREFVGRHTPDFGYVQEKLRRLEQNWAIQLDRESVVSAKDESIMTRHLRVYDSMDLTTPRALAARELVRAITNRATTDELDKPISEIRATFGIEEIKVPPEVPPEMKAVPGVLEEATPAPLVVDMPEAKDLADDLAEYRDMLATFEIEVPEAIALPKGVIPPALMPPVEEPPTGRAWPMGAPPEKLPGVAVTPRYTARGRKDAFSPEVVLGRPLTDKEIKILEVSSEPTENKVGHRFYWSWKRNAAMQYQEDTGFQLYTEGVRPALQAEFRMMQFKAGTKPLVKEMKKKLSSEEIVDLDLHMKLEQAIYELSNFAEPNETVEKTVSMYQKTLDSIKLNAAQLEVKSAWRSLSDFLFNSAGIDPNMYKQKYVPIIEDRPDDIYPPEFWGLYAKDYKPWFMKHRSSIGKIPTDYNVFDMLDMYIDATAWKKYNDDLKPVEDLIKRLPGSQVKKGTPLYEWTRWMRWLKTGDYDATLFQLGKGMREKIDKSMIKYFGWAIPKDVNLGRFIVGQIYLGTMAFNPSPPLKNITQGSQNIAEKPIHKLVAGLKFMATPEGRELFKSSGVTPGFAPYLQRQYGLKPGASKLRKLIYYAQEVPTRIGMTPFSGVDVWLNRAGIWPAEYVDIMHNGMKYVKGDMTWDEFTDEVDLYGLHPTTYRGIQSMLDTDKQIYDLWLTDPKVHPEPDYAKLDLAAHVCAFELTLRTQYGYFKSNRPYIGTQGGIGSVAFQYCSWPVGKVEQQAEILGAAQRLFKEGKNKQGFYQLWKESKQVLFWVVLALLAEGAGIEGRKLARRWGLGWMPTTAGPGISGAEDIVASVVGSLTTYKWGTKPIDVVLDEYLNIFDPTSQWRSKYRRMKPYETPYQKTLKLMGLPVGPGGSLPGIDLVDKWREDVWQGLPPISLGEWIEEVWEK